MGNWAGLSNKLERNGESNSKSSTRDCRSNEDLLKLKDHLRVEPWASGKLMEKLVLHSERC